MDNDKQQTGKTLTDADFVDFYIKLVNMYMASMIYTPEGASELLRKAREEIMGSGMDAEAEERLYQWICEKEKEI